MQVQEQKSAVGAPAGRERGNAPARLLAAASAVMIERGSTELTLKDVAARSGLNGALVKYHFGSKTGLLIALLKRDALAAVRQLNILLRQRISPTEKLKLHIAGIVNAYYRSPYLNRLIHDLLYQSSAEVGQQVSDFFVTPVVEFHRKLLQEGQRAGEFRAVDPMLFYFTLFGAIDHMFHARHTLLYGFQVPEVTQAMCDDLIGFVTDMALGAVLAEPG